MFGQDREKHKRDDVFGVSRNVPINYIERPNVDQELLDILSQNKHIVIYGSSKQGKTCLRKHCFDEDERITIQCSNKWDLADIHSSILKEAGYRITVSEKTAISGSKKIQASIRSGLIDVSGEIGTDTTEEKDERELELDPENVNDIIRALKDIGFEKYIVLEDFHYLPNEVQEDFAVSLKAFHEASNLSFVIVGVWLEKNRLIVHNGDLSGRVIAVNADEWSNLQLNEVIKRGRDYLILNLIQISRKIW